MNSSREQREVRPERRFLSLGMSFSHEEKWSMVNETGRLANSIGVPNSRSSRGESIDRHFPEGKGSSSCNPSSSSLKWSYFDLGFDRLHSTRHILPAIEKLTVASETRPNEYSRLLSPSFFFFFLRPFSRGRKPSSLYKITAYMCLSRY